MSQALRLKLRINIMTKANKSAEPMRYLKRWEWRSDTKDIIIGQIKTKIIAGRCLG